MPYGAPMMECRLGDIRLPVTPSEMNVVYEAHMLNHNIIAKGRVSTPRGREPIVVDWKGEFPGKPMVQFLPYIKEWQDPDTIVTQIGLWTMGGTRVPLVITPSEINMSVYIRRFSAPIGAPYNSRKYEITCEEARPLDLSGTKNPLNFTREVPKSDQVFIVPPNYTWRDVANSALKNPDRWHDIMEANPQIRDLVGSDGRVPPGTTLIIPPA
jgi:hypothetical protein